MCTACALAALLLTDAVFEVKYDETMETVPAVMHTAPPCATCAGERGARVGVGVRSRASSTRRARQKQDVCFQNRVLPRPRRNPTGYAAGTPLGRLPRVD